MSNFRIQKPNLRFNRSLTPLRPSNIRGTVIHHTAHQTWGLMDTHRYHRDRLGWTGIGYNFFILRSGTIYEARGHNVGAHAAGVNSQYVGICFAGDFERGSQRPTQAQLEAGAWLVNELEKTYSRAKNVVGHRDVGSTVCPGRRFPMDEFRRMVNGTSGRFQDLSNRDKYAENTRLVGDVEAFQKLLMRAGHDLPRFGADGDWGGETQSALEDFQRKHEISSPSGRFFGRAGDQTRQVLADVVQPPTFTEASDEEKYKRITDAVDSVTQLQTKLLRAGEKLPEFGVDGGVGAETLAAIQSFQRKHGLSSPGGNFFGYPGTRTMQKLDEVVRSNRYRIRSGDTYWGMANRNGISVSDIEDANPGVNPSRLSIGQTIYIPKK